MEACRTVTKASAGVARIGGSLLLALALLQPTQAGETQIVIGTASSTGVYHITGQAFCRLIEGPCHARPSEGSVANLRDLRHGEVPIALAQSDQQYHAVEGRENFADAGPDDSLRALFSVHSEPFTLVVRREAGIQGFDDLEQRAVNIGNPGSGQRATMLQLMSARGWSLDDFALVNELPADQQSLELCHGNIDAMVYTVGHPDLTIRQAVDLCNAAVVGVEGDFVEALVDDAPYYSLAEIPAGLYYPEQPEVKTFGVRATVVASEATDPDQVYTLVAAVFDNFERFTAFHPAYSVLEPERMIKEGLSAPLHEGALRYYRERGWIEDEANGEGNDAAGETEPSAATD
jgi:uncharacterized protein